VRSGNRAITSAATALTVTALAGCVSTQTKNARTVLLNERTIATERPVQVTQRNPSVAVQAVGTLRASGGLAVIVTLRNRGSHAVSDLPISVGLRPPHGRAVYLNRRANEPYYSNHVAAIAPGSSSIWVLPLRHAPAAGGAPFAIVGLAGTPAGTRASSIPQLKVSTATGASSPGRLQVSVANLSGIPQYGLPVYAIAVHDGRFVAAARGSIGELDAGSSRQLALTLLGRAAGASFELSAPATVFN
jgi:hypothetical protein